MAKKGKGGQREGTEGRRNEDDEEEREGGGGVDGGGGPKRGNLMI